MIKRWHLLCSGCNRLIDRVSVVEGAGNKACSGCGSATYFLCCGIPRKTFFGLITIRCKEPVSDSRWDHFCAGCGGDQRPIKRKYPNLFTIDGESTLQPGTFENGMVSPAQLHVRWPPPPPRATSPIEEQAAGLMPDQEPTKEATIEARIREIMEKQDDDILFDPRDV